MGRSWTAVRSTIVSESEPRLVLVVNPPDDEEFRSSAEHLIEGGLVAPKLLQDGLRRRWPSALVRPRELADERARTWYVYRDGHWVRPGR